MALIDKLTAIGDAIREKTGSTQPLTLDEMATQIAGIKTSLELNFEVVGGETQPSDHIENTIWVNTDIAITSWIFSEAEPEYPVDGMVWILLGDINSNGFNALKENSIMIYPISAKQYVSGTWTDKTVHSYQNDAWVSWLTTYYIYNEGVVNLGTLTTSSTHATVGENAINLSYSGNYGGWGCFTEKKDLTNYKTLNAKGTQTDAVTNAYFDGNIIVSVTTSTPEQSAVTTVTSRSAAYLQFSKATTETEFSVDISALSGEYYIEFAAIANGTISAIWLE